MDIIKLKEEQLKLAKKISLEDGFSEINLIAGADQIMVGDSILSVIVVLDAESLKIVDAAHVVQKPKFKYIPGLLAYRESPIMVEAFSKLRRRPDLLFVKGNGILHPRGIGLASHVGLLLDVPTIGVAKKLVLGKEEQEALYIDDKLVGFSLMTREHAKPIYISPGHLISLDSAREVTERFCIGQKMPEPLHIAHRMGAKLKRPLNQEGIEDSGISQKE
ncbi:MAG: endonuclease V [DPANN group archaeon]|nr:endonuclease V [DPANN group archaeon]